MSQITLQCRLVVSESTRHHLWKLMADLNTPLINELLAQQLCFLTLVAAHPDAAVFGRIGALPAIRAWVYCCSGYRITSEQGGTLLNYSFEGLKSRQNF